MTKVIRVVRSIAEYRSLRSEWYRNGYTVGMVPTMGALHAGHASLASQARQECDKVVATVFVNPAQFAPHEDLSKYPRTEEADIALLASKGVDVVLFPTVDEMYPAGITLKVADQVGTFVTVQGKSHQMEGSIRPHFFRGVATVVTKLFNIVQPTFAYFGQKDVQQCSVVKSMTRDLLVPTAIRVCATIREEDGLAMSSRNRFLSPSERAIAPILYKGMQAAVTAYDSGTVSRKELVQAIERIVATKECKLEYISIADPFYLGELDVVGKEGAILSGAIKVGHTRIIDNVLLGMDMKAV